MRNVRGSGSDSGALQDPHEPGILTVRFRRDGRTAQFELRACAVRRELRYGHASNFRKRMFVVAAVAHCSPPRPRPATSPRQGASADIDPAKLATVERGTMVRSVVATGKVEPITKVEIKSQGERHHQGAPRRTSTASWHEGDVLAELDKDQLLAQVRGAEANLLAAQRGARRRRGAAEEEPRRSRRPRRRVRAPGLRARADAFRAAPHRAVRARRCAQRGRRGGEPQARRAVAAGRQPGEGGGGARAGRPGQGGRRPRRRGSRERHHPRADPRHRAHARRRDRQPGVVDPQSGRQRDARDDARRHRPGIRSRQGRRGRHRPRAARPGRRASASRRSRTRSSTARSRRSRRWASRRTTSPTSKCACRSTTRARNSRRT